MMNFGKNVFPAILIAFQVCAGMAFSQGAKQYITETMVDVFKEPAQDSERLFRVFTGEPVTVLEQKDGWANVETSDHWKGWVPASVLSTIFIPNREGGRYVPPTVVQRQLAKMLTEPESEGKGLLLILAENSPKLVKKGFIELEPGPHVVGALFDASEEGKQFRFFLRLALIEKSGRYYEVLKAMGQALFDNETLTDEFLKTLFLSSENTVSQPPKKALLDGYLADGKTYLEKERYLECFYLMKVLYQMEPENLEAYKLKGRAEVALGLRK